MKPLPVRCATLSPRKAMAANVALFGTSADPPTIGHRHILAWLAQRFDRCAVWVTDNPFKTHQASLEHRIAMMGLLVNSLHPACANVELRPDIAHPHTLVVVERARQIWPQARFTLAIGADIVPQLPSWYRSAELLRQVDVVAIPRAGYVLTPADVQRLESLGTQVAIADLCAPGVSSSLYRDRGDRSGIIPSVAEYIAREHLYAWQTASAASR